MSVLDDLRYELVEPLLYQCLETGVPPAIVARIFGMDVGVVRDCLKEVRTAKFGFTDLPDYAEHLAWVSYSEAERMLLHGTSAEKSKVATALLGKVIALQGRRTPERDREARDTLLEALDEMAHGPAKKSEGPDPRFLAYADGEDV